ncbi:hypothetical protein PAXRUDRAFT_776254 [Paxillus rubicundulus Ve08.2h10]|uniref:Unplaced genomic scaffold scaffold_201, whole genome shotgun sequence n=1 Tax=Paxillus rubicundulus Ve08.2h10 TaxID=930991 RepID=A0A0D0E3X4_9AGAM|nr:hypothetical protein PAXRUDRAFT_776254 [Paxillus rubicundulus Ve08.2h10]
MAMQCCRLMPPGSHAFCTACRTTCMLPCRSYNSIIMEAGPSDQQDGLQYNCVCAKYNFRCPHLISSTTWCCLLEEATSDEERQCMHNAKSQFHPPANPPTNGRSRGVVSCKCNNVLPTQKRGQGIDASHQQDELEQPDQVCSFSKSSDHFT